MRCARTGIVLFAGVIATMAGCFGVRPALAPTAWDAGEPTARVTIDWPRRWGDAVAGPGVLVALEGEPRAHRGRRYGPDHFGRPTADDEAMIARLADGRAGAAGYRYRLEGPGGYVLVDDRARGTDSASESPGNPPSPWSFEVFVSGRDVGDVGGPRSIEVQRTWMTTLVPREGAIKGLAVVLPGLYGSPRPLFESVADALVEDGWAVVRLLVLPSRFMETTELLLDPAEAQASADRAAAVLDERIAEVAYAVEASIGRAVDQRRELAALPRVLIGMSGGALATPAVAARMIDRTGRGFDSVVMVAGGENTLRISGESAYAAMIDSLRLRWPGWEEGEVLPPGYVLRAVSDLYFESSELDAGRLAWALRDSRVLIVHGLKDQVVPSASGEALWLRLGRPERWEARTGHLALFFRLWLKKAELVRWLDPASQNADTEDHVPAGGVAARGVWGP